MRYQSNHAAPNGSVPFMLRGPKSLRVVLSAAVATAIGLTPALMLSSPAQAAPVTSTDVAFSAPAASYVVPESVGTAQIELDWIGAPPASATGITWSTSDGTAKAPYDYTAQTAQTVTWNAGKAMLSVPIIDDTTDEPDETFTVNVTDSSGNTASQVITITDNDSAPTYTMTADKTTVTEGTDTAVTVTVRLAAASGQNVSIPITTVDGTAKAGSDYMAYGTPVTFSPGETVKTFQVPIINDTTDEDDQTFQIKASAGTNVTGVADTITITIVDNDDPPTVSFSSTSAGATEGSDVTFNAVLSAPSDKTVTVKYDTSDLTSGQQVPTTDGLATAGKDYTAVSGGLLTFAPGDTMKSAVVHTTTDDLDEVTPEDFKVTLNTPTNATLATSNVTAIGHIADPNTTTSPTVTLSPKMVDEGNTTSSKTFTVTLSKPSGKTQVVHWDAGTVLADTATAGKDFKTANGDLTFAAGETVKTFTVDILGDTIYEGANETFTITLANKDSNSTLSNTTGDLKANSITITDDDAKPTFSVNDVTMKEGDSASVALYTVTLTNPTYLDTTYTITNATAGDTAKATPNGPFGSDDYALPVTTVTIPAGQTMGYAFALVKGDSIYEADETATLTFTVTSGMAAVTNTTATGKLVLQNDDMAPMLAVVNATGNEGDTVAVKGIITGQSQTETDYNVSFAGKSVNGSVAASADDFTNPGVKYVSVPAGTDIGTSFDLGNVMLTKDDKTEPAETIVVSGVGLNNVGTVKDGVVTIAASTGTTPPAETKVTLSADRKVQMGAGTAALKGKTTASLPVDLWAAHYGSTDWAKIDSATADTDGDFNFNVNLTKTGMMYKAMANSVTSSPVTIWMQEKPMLTAYSNTTGRVSLVVKANPAWEGQSATFQMWNASTMKWTTIGSGKINSDGIWSATWNKQKSGSKITYRGWVAGDADSGVLSGNSESKTVTVK